jgi:serine/threonine protein kinase
VEVIGGAIGHGMAAREDHTEKIPCIPDHELIRRIGKGAYGEVWLARNVLGRYRAIKIVQRNAFSHARPFEREFEGIQRFEPISRSHPGFVSILHVGRNAAAGSFYYIMEVADDVANQQNIQSPTYVARTLLGDIKKRGLLPVRESVQLGISLSAALAYLHSHGLVHRDIKPSNIIYINGTPRLADVGLVATVRDDLSCVGTLGFIPKEGPGSIRADIFGLGKVVYLAATGMPIDQFPCLPTSVVEGTDWPLFAGLNRMFLKACAEEARDRYQTCDELQADLSVLQTTGASAEVGESATASGSSQSKPVQPRRVTLLHRANTEPDGRLLQFLRQRLVGQGIEVSIDEHLTVGVEWAQGLEDKIRAADAVIVLLSASSIQSEMLAYEIDMAHQAAQQQKGYPRCVPVRVKFTEPWPENLRPYLDSLAPICWNDGTDDERMVEELVRALEVSQRAPVGKVRPKIEPAGGAVDLASQYYVVRPTDLAFCEAVARWDSIVLVKGARQMGKTSLLARGLDQARQAGAKVALTDFQKLSFQDLQSAESFFLALGGFLADKLDLTVLPDANWEKRCSPNINFERYLRREVLGRFPGHLVWGLDEVDRLFTCSFGSEVFGLFRSWHNERALDPSGPWSRLTLAIAYATEASLFITDVNQSPFNVGTRMDLEDFTLEQVADLNGRYGSPLRNEAELRRFHALLGGQPYLVRRALNELAEERVKFEVLVAEADRDEGIFGDHLRRMLVMLAKDSELMETVRGMLQGKPSLTVASFYRLRSGGLLRGNSLADAQLRCEIYGTYLKRHLL